MSAFRQKISNLSKNHQNFSIFASQMSVFCAKIENQGNLSEIVRKCPIFHDSGLKIVEKLPKFG